MKTCFSKLLLLLVFFSGSFFCLAQKEKKVSVEISTDYGFGKDFNNYASTVRLNYFLIEKFRISPSFSYYFNKDNKKMNIFSFNFHYVFSDLIPKLFPVMEDQGLYFYPVAGFCIANLDYPKRNCSNCSETVTSSGSNYTYNFGFDFGAGVDYDLPTLLPVLRDMSANFEIQYQALEQYNRPQLSFGIMYNF
ncbi:MAG TPA: hypothetical protein DEQ30_04200 [Porphyromonadaceae bacterium]|nr:hypothetical protein [Porphyromonadaceae bacterium]